MTYNSLSQDTEIELINLLVPHLENKNFIDIGAEKGVFALTLLAHEMNGILFEPMPKHRITLQKIVDQYPSTILHSCAITNTDSIQQFNIATDDNGNELDFYHSLQKANAPGVFSHSKSFEVDCRSIQSLIATGEILTSLGVLKTDTEGNDLNVLRGLGALRPELVICEYFSKDLYDGWPEGGPEPIIEHMQNLGYSTFLATKRVDGLEFITVNSPLFSKKQWGNLFFFRPDFFKNVESIIANFVNDNEEYLIGKFNRIQLELEEKESVIQDLLLERRAAITQNSVEKGLLPSFFRLLKK